MTPAATKKFLLIAGVVLAVVFVGVAQLASPMHIRFESTTAALSLITVSAIGIERIIEIFWTYIGQTKGSWWPLKEASDYINKTVASFDEIVQPVYDQVSGIIARAEAQGYTEDWPREKVDAAKKELEKLQENLKWIQNLAPDSQRVQLAAAQAYQNISYLNAKYPAVHNTAAIAGQAITGVTDFVATFKDNPGRRLISICFGALVGMLISWLSGMDVFSAAGEVALAPANATLLPNIGIALTGVLIGLGSNPTHEVIRVLQEMKKNRTLANAPVPEMEAPPEQEISFSMMREASSLGGNGGDMMRDMQGMTRVQTQSKPVKFSTFTLRK